MSESGSSETPEFHLWRRWSAEDEVPFHRFCVVFPVTYRNGSLELQLKPDEKPPIQLVPSAVRVVLRHTPLVISVLIVSFLLIDMTRASGSVLVGALDGQLSWRAMGALGLLVGWFLALVTLIRTTLGSPQQESVQGIVVYGLLGGLTVGVLLGLYATHTARISDPAAKVPTFAVDLWLTLLLGGLLIYDGLLRTENLFGRLEDKEPSIIDDAEAYRDEFLTPLEERLTATFDTSNSRLAAVLPIRSDRLAAIPMVYIFAGLFVTPFLGIWMYWSLRNTPSQTSLILLSLVQDLLLAAASFVIVVVAHQFLILLIMFHKLLTDHAPTEDDSQTFHLQYIPSHPDRYAGYRDFGRFAMRVNVLLLLGGFYHAIRVYLYGIPLLYEANTTTVRIIWAIDHIVPFLVYLLFAILWLYLSFWQIHKTMRRGFEIELAARASDVGGSMQETFSQFEQSPVWPINQRLLLSLISADMIPLLGILPFIPN